MDFKRRHAERTSGDPVSPVDVGPKTRPDSGPTPNIVRQRQDIALRPVEEHLKVNRINQNVDESLSVPSGTHP